MLAQPPIVLPASQAALLAENGMLTPGTAELLKVGASLQSPIAESPERALASSPWENVIFVSHLQGLFQKRGGKYQENKKN